VSVIGPSEVNEHSPAAQRGEVTSSFFVAVPQVDR